MKAILAAIALMVLLGTQAVQAQTRESQELKALQVDAVKALLAQDHEAVQALAQRIEAMVDQGLRAPGQNGLSQYGLVAELLFRAEDAQGAARAYRKALETAQAEGLWSQDSVFSVRYEYGNLLLLLGRYPDALTEAQALFADLEHLDRLSSSVGMDAVILMGLVHQAMSDHDQSRRFFAAAVSIAEEHDDSGQKLRIALAGLSVALTQMGAAEAALDPYRRVVELDRELGIHTSEMALHFRLQYGMALEDAGRFDEAREVIETLLADARDNPSVGPDLVQFAHQTLENIDRAEGRKQAATTRNRQLAETVGDDETPSGKLNALLNLAAHNLANDEQDAYEAALVAALQLIRTHPDAAPRTQHAEIMFALADFLSGKRLMFMEARALYDRSIEILTEELGAEHLETLMAKARRLQAKDHEIQANASLQRPASELAFWDGTDAGRKPTAADLEVWRKLARAQQEQGSRFEIYASNLRYAFYLAEADQFDLALGVIDAQIAARAEEIRETARPDPEQDYRLADAKGTTLMKAGQFAAAAEVFRSGTDPFLSFLRGGQWKGGTPDTPLHGQVYGEFYASAALRAAQLNAAERELYTRTGFEAMQLAGYGPASAAVARAVTREAAADPDFVRQAAELQNAILGAASSSGRSPDPDRLRSRMSAEFARYFEWQIPTPLDLSEVQQTLLHPDEALITILTATTQGASEDGVNGLVLAATREDAVLVEIPVSWAQVVQDILALHQTLDPKAPAQLAALRAPLASVQGAPDPTRLSAPYAFEAAARLHDAFFAIPEVAALIGPKPVWTLVPYGETLGIPFAALIVDDPNGPVSDHQRSAAELRDIRWLGLERALQVVPSVHALKTLRDRAPRRDDNSQLAYVGIGAPAFGGEQLAALPSLDTVMRRTAPDRAQAVGALPPLPGTRREIETLAGVFGVDRSEIRLGADANEAQISALNDAGDLAQADIVHFATHGLLSGAFEGLAEPALALTPGTAGSDGLLTASEASRLQLDADWVILSACDTAGEDTFGGEGLGGLVQGFLTAGARNVLASHWRVEDQAAEHLITRAVILSQDGVGKAEALRRAMRDLAADDTRDQTVLPNSHPSVWAPFLMIGGG